MQGLKRKIGWMRDAVMLFAAVAFIFLVITLTLFKGAQAHSWYDLWCCRAVTETGGDCAPIPDRAVRAVPGGFEVSLESEDHPKVRYPIREFVPHDKARRSRDEDHHACVLGGRLRCLYVPHTGS